MLVSANKVKAGINFGQSLEKGLIWKGFKKMWAESRSEIEYECI